MTRQEIQEHAEIVAKYITLSTLETELQDIEEFAEPSKSTEECLEVLRAAILYIN